MEKQFQGLRSVENSLKNSNNDLLTKPLTVNELHQTI